ncbi:MAG TPA: cytochrome c [Candidatus Competibacteraceae bacterium]|nr:cytochrome c [Candidatus Competibacteraceae bacterium]
MNGKALLATLLIAPLAWADESALRLKEGPGRELVEANCALCHSLDYVQMNSVFLDRKGWEASVNKMVKVMGAELHPEDIPRIVDYLTAAYGK